MKMTNEAEETVRPEEFRKMQINARERAWKEKKCIDKTLEIWLITLIKIRPEDGSKMMT